MRKKLREIKCCYERYLAGLFLELFCTALDLRRLAEFFVKTYLTLIFEIWTNFLELTVQITVWKFHDFSVIQILREINFGESRSSITAIIGL